AIAAGHQPLFEGFLRGSRLANLGATLRFLTPDVALIHSKGAVVLARQKRPAHRRLSVQTLVAVKRQGAWCLAAFQNTRYHPFTRTLLGKALLRLAPRSKSLQPPPESHG